MKKISDLKRQLDNLQDNDVDLLAPPMPSSANQRNQAKFINTCIAYLETNPSPEFISREIARLENRIAEIMRLENCWATDRQFESEEKRTLAYRAHCNISHLENHLKTLKFLAE